jgi:hypothetical protein
MLLPETSRGIGAKQADGASSVASHRGRPFIWVPYSVGPGSFGKSEAKDPGIRVPSWHSLIRQRKPANFDETVVLPAS